MDLQIRQLLGPMMTAIHEHNVESLKQLLMLYRSPEVCRQTLSLALEKGMRDLSNLNQDNPAHEEAIKITKTRNMEIVKICLEHGADVNAISDIYTNGSPFKYACLHASADIVKMMMLDHGADLELDNLADGNHAGAHPIKNVFSSGDREKIDLFFGMLDTAKVRQWHLLHKYVQNRNPQEEILTKLVKLGADVNGVDERGLTVLHCAIFGRNLDCLRFLIKAGTNVNVLVRYYDHSLLDLAVSYRLTGYVRVLLQHGADVNLGRTNLIRTALFAYPLEDDFEEFQEMIELLLSYGADINKHIYGIQSSPLSIAFQVGHERLCKYLIRTIILMKAQDLLVSDENLRASETRGQFCQYQKKCVKEIELLKEEKFKDSSLFYLDILAVKDVPKLASLARNKNIVRVLKSYDFKKKFPIYGNSIVEHFDKGIRVNKDFELLQRFVNYLSSGKVVKLPKLPFTFVCELFTYLSCEDVAALRKL